MLLEGKKVVIMGIRNKWSIAWGAAQSAYENGAQVIFTHNTLENEEKIKELIAEIPGAKSFPCDAGSDESIRTCLETIKKEYGKIDGILHSIAHANTTDLRNDFVLTSRDGFAHACDISSYSLVAVARIAREIDLFNENARLRFVFRFFSLFANSRTNHVCLCITSLGREVVGIETCHLNILIQSNESSLMNMREKADGRVQMHDFVDVLVSCSSYVRSLANVRPLEVQVS